MLASRRFALSLIFTALLLTACAASERHERTIWYVSTTGNDTAICTELTDPCLTLAEALDRSDEDDKIILAAGIYNEVGTDTRFPPGTFTIEASLWITGAGIGETVIDMTGSGGILILGPGSYQLDNFTIRNGESTCIDIGSTEGNTATIENVEATGCGRSGFSAGDSDAVVTLINVIASSNERNGAEIYAAEMIIQGGEFSDNGDTGIAARNPDSSLTVDGAIIQGNSRNGVVLVRERRL